VLSHKRSDVFGHWVRPAAFILGAAVAVAGAASGLPAAATTGLATLGTLSVQQLARAVVLSLVS
jgi:hypothetical protein